MKNYFTKTIIPLLSLIFISIQSFGQCNYVVDMQDSYGDGWNGASIDISVNGNTVANFSFATGNTAIDSIATYTNDIVDFSFNSGTFDNEITFQIYAPNGTQIGNYGPTPAVGLFLTDTSNSACATPSCLPAGSFLSYNITANSADISFSAGSNALTYNIEYGASGFALGSGNSATSNSGIYTITGLSPSSSYDVFLQADCGGGDTSTWSGPFTFATSIQSAGSINCTTGYPGSAFVDDLETQGLWTGDFGTGNGVWKVNTGTTSSLNTGPSGAHSGLNYFFYETSTGGGNSGSIVSPAIDLTTAAGDAELSFWLHAFGSAIGTLDVGIGNTSSGPFTNIFTVSGPQQNSMADPFNNVGINIASYIGQTIYLEFTYTRGTTGTSFEGDLAIDLIEVISCFNCPGPSNITAFNTVGNATEITWNPSGAETSWNIWYNPTGSPMANQTTVTNDSITLSGLTPITTYEFYVQANCSTDSSIIVGPYFFTTPCAALTPPQLEDFSAGFPPNTCWEQADDGDPGTGPTGIGTSGWFTDGFGNIGTTGAVKINLYSTFKSDWILSPQYDLTSGGPFQVELDFGVFTWNNTSPDQLGSDDRVELLISTDGGVTWAGLTNWNSSYVTGTNGNHEIIPIPNYSGNTVQFAIWASEGTIDDPEDVDVMIDNFAVYPIPTCPQPLYLNAFNISSTSADLTWIPGGTETDWLVYLVPNGGSPTSVTPIAVTNDTTTVSNLLPNTMYEFYVQAVCSTTDSSFISGPYTFTLLCSVSSSPFFDDFESHTASTNVVQTNCWDVIATTVGFDWNIDGAGSTPSLNTGPSGAYSGVNYAYVEASSGTAGAIALFESPLIDVSNLTNPQLDFYYHMFGSAMGDLLISVYDGNNWITMDSIMGQQQTADTDPWLNRIIPLSSFVGDTIRVRFTAYKGTSFQGDISIDDFRIGEAPNCPQPAFLNAFNINPTSATLTWTPTGSETSWALYVVNSGSSLANTTPTIESNDTINITSLSSSSSYSFYVQALCGADSSYISGPFSFSTPCTSTPAPYTETFDNPITPLCWTDSYIQGDGWRYTGSPGYGAANASDHTGNGGSFAWVDFSGTDQGTVLESPIIDVSALASPILELYFYSNNTNNSDLNLLIIEMWDSTNWITIDTISQNGALWDKFDYNIANYSYNNGNYVKARFRAESGGATNDFYNDLLIDDVSFKEAPMNDVGVINGEVPTATTGCEMDSSLVVATIFNYGYAPQTGFNVEYNLNGTPVVETIFDTIPASGTLVHTFASKVDLTQDGTYDFNFTTSLPSDTDNSNDGFGTISFENYYTPYAPSTTDDTVCVSGSATLTATGPSGVTIEWFDNPGGNVIGTGDTLITPTISTSTIYWAAYQDMSPGNMGPANNTLGAGGGYNFYNVGVLFDIYSPISLDSVTVYPSDTGYVELIIGDAIGSTLYTDFYHVTGPIPANGAVKIPIGIDIQPGFSYSMIAGNNTTTTGLYRNSAGASYPYNFGADAAITGPSNNLAGFYYFFYNWDVSSVSCYSNAQQATAFVDPCTGINENFSNPFTITPNPNNGRFEISFSNQLNSGSEITITDINGRLISKEYIISTKKPIRLSNVEKGIYVVTIDDGINKSYKRVIIQ